MKITLLALLVSTFGFSQYTFRIYSTEPNESLRNIQIELSINKLTERNDQANAVIQISRELEKHLGNVLYHNEEYRFKGLKKYDIIKTSRVFEEHGWLDLLEITEKGTYYEGFVNGRNPSWMKVEGTATINLPPEDVVNRVLLELQDYILIDDLKIMEN